MPIYGKISTIINKDKRKEIMKIHYEIWILTSLLYSTYTMQPPLIDPSQKEEIKKVLQIEDATPLKLLLAQGLDPNTIFETKNEKKINLLQEAAQHFCWFKESNYKVIATLIKCGAHANHEQDLPLLHCLSHHSNIYSVLTALCAGYDPNKQTPNFYTPLIFAARNGYAGVNVTDHWAAIKFLLAAGAGASLKVQCVPDPDEPNQSKNVFEYATYWKNKIALQILRAEEKRWDKYEFLQASLKEIIKQKNTLLSYLPSELIIYLFNYLQPHYNLDFTIPDEVLDSIKQELGLQQLPVWAQKARESDNKIENIIYKTMMTVESF